MSCSLFDHSVPSLTTVAPTSKQGSDCFSHFPLVTIHTPPSIAVAPTLQRHPVCGGDVLAISGQDLLVVSAPGHTDGHLALFHSPSRMLIAGDHCVG